MSTCDFDDEFFLDAGCRIPGAGQQPLPTSVAADESFQLETFQLRDVMNDTWTKPFCGPTAVAAITGAPLSLVLDSYRLVRHGPEWVDRGRTPRITGAALRETEETLRLLGFVGEWHQIERAPTLDAFAASRSDKMRTHPLLVVVTGHYVAIHGERFCDTFSRGKVVNLDKAPRRRKRVRKVLLITGKVPPSTQIPRNDWSRLKPIATKPWHAQFEPTSMPIS